MDTTPGKKDEQELDEALEDTFPASDPPANSGTTGPGDTPGPGRKTGADVPPQSAI